MVFVRPLQNGTHQPATRRAKYAYNDGDGSTRYDREFAFMITEIFAEGHYRDAHIQTTDWTDFDASFWCLNGRTYPDTIQPNAPWVDVPPSDGTARSRGFDPNAPTGVTANDGTRVCSTSRSRPWSRRNAGERVLLRLSNLGYQNHAMTVDEIDLKIVAKDASLLTVGGLVTEGGRPLPSPRTRSTSGRARAATSSSPRRRTAAARVPTCTCCTTGTTPTPATRGSPAFRAA